jgi:hypothetical protein
MGNSKNDDRDQGDTKSTPPQARETTNRDFEEGRNITNQGWTGPKPANRDGEKKDDEQGPSDIDE